MQIEIFGPDEQVKVPKSVQDALGIRPGDQVGFEIRNDGAMLVRADRPKAPASNLLALRGILKPTVRGVSVEQMNETIRHMDGSGE